MFGKKSAKSANEGGRRRSGNEVAPESLLAVLFILFAVSPLR
jgi:hypothetical protein